MTFVFVVLAKAADAAVQWTDIVTALGSLGVLVTLLFAVRQLAESKCDRHVTILAELGRRWDDEKLVESRTKALPYDRKQLATRIRELWTREDKPADPDADDLYVLLRVPNFYEDFGLMVEAGSFNLDLAWRAFGVVDEWRYWEETIDVMREDDPFAYSEFEKLATDLLPLEEARKEELDAAKRAEGHTGGGT